MASPALSPELGLVRLLSLSLLCPCLRSCRARRHFCCRFQSRTQRSLFLQLLLLLGLFYFLGPTILGMPVLLGSLGDFSSRQLP